MRHYLLPFLVAGLVAGLFTVALAKDAGKPPVPARTPGGAVTVYYGVITALSPDSLTLKPEAPKGAASRLRRKGSPAVQLPSSVTARLRKSTRWYFKDAEGSAKDFAVGDTIRLKVRSKAGANQDPVALVVSDPQTAFRFVTGSAGAASGHKRMRKELLKGSASAAPKRTPKPSSMNKKPSGMSNRKPGAQKAQPRTTSYERQSSAGVFILARKDRNKPDQSGINGANGGSQGSDTTKKHRGGHRLFKKRHRKHHTATYGN